MDNQTHQHTEADVAEMYDRKKNPLIRWSTHVIEILEFTRKSGRFMYAMHRYTDGGQRYVVGLIDGKIKTMRRDRFRKAPVGVIHSDYSRGLAAEDAIKRQQAQEAS